MNEAISKQIRSHMTSKSDTENIVEDKELFDIFINNFYE